MKAQAALVRLCAENKQLLVMVGDLLPLAVAWASYYRLDHNLKENHPTHQIIIDRARVVLGDQEKP